jgi:hypothetical protein
MSTTTQTITHIAKPEDKRCKCWQAPLGEEISESHLEAVIRLALYIRAHDDKQAAWEKLKAL